MGDHRPQRTPTTDLMQSKSIKKDTLWYSGVESKKDGCGHNGHNALILSSVIDQLMT